MVTDAIPLFTRGKEIVVNFRFDLFLFCFQVSLLFD